MWLLIKKQLDNFVMPSSMLNKIAIDKGHEVIVQLILEEGAIVNTCEVCICVNSWEATPL